MVLIVLVLLLLVLLLLGMIVLVLAVLVLLVSVLVVLLLVLVVVEGPIRYPEYQIRLHDVSRLSPPAHQPDKGQLLLSVQQLASEGGREGERETENTTRY